jgi:hypothetical protein
MNAFARMAAEPSLSQITSKAIIALGGNSYAIFQCFIACKM